jgi:hypothetical protein
MPQLESLPSSVPSSSRTMPSVSFATITIPPQSIPSSAICPWRRLFDCWRATTHVHSFQLKQLDGVMTNFHERWSSSLVYSTSNKTGVGPSLIITKELQCFLLAWFGSREVSHNPTHTPALTQPPNIIDTVVNPVLFGATLFGCL